MKEIWKDIPGYVGHYQVSNFGKVKSIKFGKERLLKPDTDKDGYYRVALYIDSKMKKYSVHQLVAITFLGHEPNGYKIVVNHIDNNPLNNYFDNLELVSTRYNTSCHKTNAGVYWNKKDNKWRGQIEINKLRIYLGSFTNKQDALDMYQKAVANIHLYNGDNKAFRLALADIAL
jgi:hypothetical protein